MNRRDFLKMGGLFSTALIVQFNPLGRITSVPVEAQTGDKHYRGTFDGKILVSTNAGKSWQSHTNFGPIFSILGINVDHQGQVRAQLGFEARSFELALAEDGKTWRTV